MLHLDEPITPGQRSFEAPDAGVRRAVRLQLRHHRDAQGGAPHARVVRGGGAALARRAAAVVGGSHADHDAAVAHPRPAQHRDGAGDRHLDPAAPPVRHRPDAAPHRVRPDHHRNGRGAHRFGAGRASGAGSLRPVVAALHDVVRDAGHARASPRPSRRRAGRELGDRLRRQRTAGDLVQRDRGRASGHRRARRCRA